MTRVEGSSNVNFNKVDRASNNLKVNDDYNVFGDGFNKDDPDKLMQNHLVDLLIEKLSSKNPVDYDMLVDFVKMAVDEIVEENIIQLSEEEVAEIKNTDSYLLRNSDVFKRVIQEMGIDLDKLKTIKDNPELLERLRNSDTARIYGEEAYETMNLSQLQNATNGREVSQSQVNNQYLNQLYAYKDVLVYLSQNVK